MREITGTIIDTRGRPDALREELSAILERQGGVWALGVRLSVDVEAMPLEDATAVWSMDLALFVPVATLTVPLQMSWISGESDMFDRELAFNAWNGLAGHRPLGGINRARKNAYRLSADYRAAFNGCPVRQPSRVIDQLRAKSANSLASHY